MTPQRWQEVERIYQAALVRAGEGRSAFLDEACPGDADLRHEVESLLESHAGAGGFLESPALEVASQMLVKQGSYQRFGPYRVIREAGHGGMGTVYLAERDDGQYARRVAIKVVNGIASEELMHRFRREREILAALDHPHIARLEDAGLDDEGTPYLVMELVEGQPLNRYCDEHRLGTNARCRLFIAICRAVHHAHRHLVIHRDLKPSNILVTAEGTPKLLDFGIAKLLASEQTAAGPHSVVLALTPAYASPEQMLGKHLATASDIYSLGVLLYELLVGRRPFDFSGASLAQAAEIAANQSPEKPSAASGKKELRGDLDAIVFHAMAGEEDERYGSAEELAADLERHLSRRPVRAQPRGWRYVTRKFLSRHRRAAWASAAAFLAFAGVFTAALVERHTALREREAATRRFNHVRKLAYAIINEFDQRAAAVPGNLELRKLMVARSTEYLKLLAMEDLSGDPGLLRELADSFVKLGDILGNSGISNLGDTQSALADYQQARTLLERLIQRKPADLEPRLALGRLLIAMSNVLANSGQLPESKRTTLDAYRYWEALLGQFPQEARVSVGFADACFGIAMRSESSRPMITYYNRALEIYEALARQQPQEDRYQRNMALVHKYVAGIYLQPWTFGFTDREAAKDLYDLETALRHKLVAEQIDARRVAAHPEDRMAKLDHSFDLSMLGTYEENRRNYKQAAAYFVRVVNIRRELWTLEPKDVRARDRLADALAYLAAAQARAHHPGTAWRHLTEAVDHWHALARAGRPSDSISEHIVYASIAVGLEDRRSSPESGCRGVNLARTFLQKPAAPTAHHQAWVSDIFKRYSQLLDSCPDNSGSR